MIDHSHGLRYQLSAAVAGQSVLRRLSRLHPVATVVPLPVADLGLMPITEQVAARFNPAALCQLQPEDVAGPTSSGAAGAELVTGPESGFSDLTPALLALFEIGSHHGPIAYLEADYLGRDGRQTAAVWRHGRLAVGPLLLGRDEVFAPRRAPISVALRALGVSAIGRRDEFVVAGLGRCRTTSEWAGTPWSGS